jgi:type I restriction enzyme S subunit
LTGLRQTHAPSAAPGFATEAERWSYGITSDQWSLRSEHFKMIYSCVPLRPEQDAIVAFLRHADAGVRRFIRNRRRLIGMLNEQKQAIINRAVTRGIDPHVPLKSFGIDWLGDIPKHWRAVRLKYVSRVQTGITLGKNYMGQEVEERPYLRVANVQTGRLDLRMVKTVAVPLSEVLSSELKPGDVLMTEGGDIDKLGRGCVWQGEIEGCLHQNHIFAVRADQSRLLPQYLVALMGSRLGRIYFQLTAKQTTNLASTNSSTLGAFPLVLPTVEEQKQILNAIEKETLPLGVAINRAQREIDLICEYRTRLIADVVTGKVDVRHLAPPAPGGHGSRGRTGGPGCGPG